MRHLLALFPVALWLAASTVSGAAHADDAGWPFGKPTGRFGAASGDYVNLGLIGAKAQDAAHEKPVLQDLGGGKRAGRAERPTHDRGPDRLEIMALFPDGPGMKAGLQIGDIVIGVGRSPFKEGSLGPLAEALRKAESGAKKGVLTLLVERDGEKRKIEVEIPPGGKALAKPTKGEGRQRIVGAALAWLAERQRSGGFGGAMGGSNRAVVNTSLAGLAWLAGGSDLDTGPYKENLARAVDFVIASLGVRAGGGDPRMSGLDQTNWGYAHAAIFLGELYARTPNRELKAALMRCGEELTKRQEASGGWAHGPGGPNPLGYLELNIVSGLALCGLGMAKQAGYVVPRETLEKAEAYLEASSGGDGGVGYSANPGQAGQGNIGRTAICWLGYVTLGIRKSAFGQKMRKWIERNAGDVLGGHASLMEHILHAGVAAHAIGGSAKSRFWEVAERDLILARAPDGSFQPRPWHESLGMGSNSDIMSGEVWSTAAWATVLACEPGAGTDLVGLPTWMGLSK